MRHLENPIDSCPEWGSFQNPENSKEHRTKKKESPSGATGTTWEGAKLKSRRLEKAEKKRKGEKKRLKPKLNTLSVCETISSRA